MHGRQPAARPRARLVFIFQSTSASRPALVESLRLSTYRQQEFTLERFSMKCLRQISHPVNAQLLLIASMEHLPKAEKALSLQQR
jgi:hypothetical protein